MSSLAGLCLATLLVTVVALLVAALLVPSVAILAVFSPQLRQAAGAAGK